MPQYNNTPYQHGQPDTARNPQYAVLLCNLGTPDAPETGAVRRYLAEFLSDPRVVEIPRLIWKTILHGIILRTRPAKSAEKYRSIWDKEGSPLLLWTQKQAALLKGYLGERGHKVAVLPAMRYGSPSMAQQLDAARAAGQHHILILPAYPQYSGTTTASVCDAVYAWAGKQRWVPTFRFVNHYHDHPAYIRAMAQRVQQHWMREGRGEHILFSFHGVPERTLKLGDPYHCHCHKTARLLAQELGLAQDKWSIAFQSRFGKAKWIEPYTDQSLKELAQQGVKELDVFCPGFTSDCLETLEEIAMEGKEIFEEAGGAQYNYIPCLNDHPAWIKALEVIAEENLAGWDTQSYADSATLEYQKQAAKKMGAER